MRSLKEYDLYRRNLDLQLIEKLNNRHYYPNIPAGFKHPESETPPQYKYSYEHSTHRESDYKLDYRRIERKLYSHERLHSEEFLRRYDHPTPFALPRIGTAAAHY